MLRESPEALMAARKLLKSSCAKRFSSMIHPGERAIGHERIRLALLAEGGGRAVARNEGHVAAQRPELRGDGTDQRVVVAARNIGAADGALEQHVADDREPVVFAVEDHVTGGVARAMAHLQGHVAECDRIAALEPAIRDERLEAPHAETHYRFGDLFDPEAVLLVRAFDREAGALSELRRAATVVHVAVGDEYLLQF